MGLRIAVLAVVLGVSAGAWALEAHARAGEQRTLSSVASELAHRPVSVHCQSFWADLVNVSNNLGEVQFDAQGNPADSTTLTRGTCSHLQHFISSHGADLECLKTVDWNGFRWDEPHDACVERAASVGQAVVVLAHESMHLRGIRSESAAQCLAEQATPWTVARLGGDPTTGLLLERLARAWNSSMPTEFQSACPAG